MKTAVVTGVSTGIGRGIAAVLAKNGWRVYGSVRKPEDAQAFEAAVGANAKALLFDVTDQRAMRDAADVLGRELGGEGLDALVNNAGIAVGGPLETLPIDDLRRQFEVNVFGLMAATQAFLPLLGAARPRRKPGRIINISSVGGKFTFPFFGPYAASKHAVESLSDALRRELMVHGIDVIVIEPGAIRTPIWDKGRDRDQSPFVGSAYETPLRNILERTRALEAGGLLPEDVGRLALSILNSARPKTRYIIQRGGALSLHVRRTLPERLVDAAIAKQLGIKRWR